MNPEQIELENNSANSTEPRSRLADEGINAAWGGIPRLSEQSLLRNRSLSGSSAANELLETSGKAVFHELNVNFRSYDKNNDGVITYDELNTPQASFFQKNLNFFANLGCCDQVDPRAGITRHDLSHLNLVVDKQAGDRYLRRQNIENQLGWIATGTLTSVMAGLCWDMGMGTSTSAFATKWVMNVNQKAFYTGMAILGAAAGAYVAYRQYKSHFEGPLQQKRWDALPVLSEFNRQNY